MARDYWFAFGSQPSAAASLAPTFISFINGSGSTITPPAIAETYAGSGLYKVSYTATQTIAFVMDGATSGLATSDRYIFGVFDPQDTMGQTLSAFAPSMLALGTTSVALGTTSVALGTTSVALGNTAVALSTNMGGTLVAIGNTSIALGSTAVALSTNGGVTLVAVGNTAIALGQTGVALSTNTGTTLIAIGNTLSALGLSLNVVITGIGSTGSTFGGASTDPDSLFGYLRRLANFLEGDQVYAKSSGVLTYSSKGSSTLFATKTITDSISAVTRS